MADTAKELLEAVYLDLRHVLAVTRLAAVGLEDLDDRLGATVDDWKVRSRDIGTVLEAVVAPLEKAMTDIDNALILVPSDAHG